MKCPYCHSEELKVIDSRNAPEMNMIRRRRECLQCEERFTTFETVELTMQVHKRDGRYEDYQQQKLIKGLDSACRHTTISHDRVIALSAEVTNGLLQKGTRAISTTKIGELVMKTLLKLDPIAYIRYACVYRRFKNIDDLMEAIQSIHSKDEENQESIEKVEELCDATEKI